MKLMLMPFITMDYFYWIYKGTFESQANAIKYIKEAADKGHIEASFKYGKLLNKRIVSTEKNIDVIKYFKYAADHKEKKSMLFYGKILYEENSEEEYEKAISYIKESADLG